MRKKKTKKYLNKNQQSFYFEDYLSTNQKLRKEKEFIINEGQGLFTFFCFFSLILIFSFKIIFVSLQHTNNVENLVYKHEANYLETI